MTSDVTERQIEAFQRFLAYLPHGGDVELVLLKAHLLIEEQIRQIIAERIDNPEALKEAKLGCHQAICLAQSFFPKNHQPWLWRAVKKLNFIRNDVAHKLEPGGLQHRIDDFVSIHPLGSASEMGAVEGFELALWGVFLSISELVERPSAEVLELVGRNGA